MNNFKIQMMLENDPKDYLQFDPRHIRVGVVGTNGKDRVYNIYATHLNFLIEALIGICHGNETEALGHLYKIQTTKVPWDVDKRYRSLHLGEEVE